MAPFLTPVSELERMQVAVTLRQRSEAARHVIDIDGRPLGGGLWPSCEEDVRAASEQFPEYILAVWTQVQGVWLCRMVFAQAGETAESAQIATFAPPPFLDKEPS